MAKGRRKQLERMDRLEALDQKEITPHFRFPAKPLTDAEHLTVKQLAVGYHYPILAGIDFSLKGGQKVVITGFNGVGKSTLLKTLVGQLPALQGQYRFSDQVVFGYFQQDMEWTDGGRTPMQLVSDAHPDLTAKEVRRCLAQCGVSGEHAVQPVGTLILDEPTNHLDRQAKDALREALVEFPGTVLLVTHEALFYRDWAERVIDMGRK